MTDEVTRDNFTEINGITDFDKQFVTAQHHRLFNARKSPNADATRSPVSLMATISQPTDESRKHRLDFSNEPKLPYQDEEDSKFGAYMNVIENGIAIEDSKSNVKVTIIGAGMAGLVSADILKRSGIKDITILEASTEIGGRAKTLRSPTFPIDQYAEAGAMRFPIEPPDLSKKTENKGHWMVREYMKRVGCTIQPFNNTANAYYYFSFLPDDKKRGLMTDLQKDHKTLDDYFNIPENERATDGINVSIIDQHVWYYPMWKTVNDEGWGALQDRFDKYSVRSYLAERYQPQTIDMWAVLSRSESTMDNALIETIREIVGGWWREDLHELTNGTQTLPEALAKTAKLRHLINYGCRATDITEKCNKKIDIRYINAFKEEVEIKDQDFVICTAPLSVMRGMRLSELPRECETAIRDLRYAPSTKVLLQYKTRWWRNDELMQGQRDGGGSITDLPIRQCYYPNHKYVDDPKEEDAQKGLNGTRGVLLASYTWGQDALVWGSLTEQEAIHRAANDVATLHGRPDSLQLLESGKLWPWFSQPDFGGAFAMFAPEQQTKYLKPITMSKMMNGRFYIAGEHASFAHGWIQGAIESAVRACYQLSFVARFDKFIKLQ